MYIFLYIDGHDTPKRSVKKIHSTETLPITKNLLDKCCEVLKIKPNKKTLILGIVKGGKS